MNGKRLGQLTFFALFLLIAAGCNKKVVLGGNALTQRSSGSDSTQSTLNNQNNASTQKQSSQAALAAPTCTWRAFDGEGPLTPGSVHPYLLIVQGSATEVLVGVKSGNDRVLSLPTPVSTMLNFSPLVTNTYVAAVRNSAGVGTCEVTVRILLPNVIGRCNGANAYQDPFCFGDFIPMATGMGSYLQYQPTDIVRTTISFRGWCSLWRSTVNNLFHWFFDATQAILVAESEGILLGSWDLKAYQSNPNRVLSLVLDMTPLKNVYGDAWRAKKVTFAVCDNVPVAGPFGTMPDFRCQTKNSSDPHGPELGISQNEIGRVNWGEMNTTFNAGEIPADFLMGLWWKKGAIPDNDNNCKIRQSPLVLNFSTDPVATVDAAHGPSFDINANGQPLRTSWIADNHGRAGFLVLNPPSASAMSAAYLFGTKTMLPNGTLPTKDHKDGFTAAALYDQNADKKLSSGDAVWSRLRVWFDDGDGVVESGEMKTMAQAGVTEISLEYGAVALVDEHGNAIYQMGLFRYGSEPKLLLDYWFYQL